MGLGGSASRADVSGDSNAPSLPALGPLQDMDPLREGASNPKRVTEAACKGAAGDWDM